MAKDVDLRFERATPGASGFDLMANIGLPRSIPVGTRFLIGTGLHLEMPHGTQAAVCSRSGLAINHGVIVLNAPGIVDSDYRGEVGVILQNLGNQEFTVLPGARIAQLVFQPYCTTSGKMPSYPTNPTAHQLRKVDRLDQLSSTDRGAGGFGSSGT